MLQSSRLLSVFKPDTLSGVLTLFNDHNLSYYQKNQNDSNSPYDNVVIVFASA